MVNQTVYFVFNDSYWTEDKPEGKYKEDYTLMRKGTKLKCYELEDKEYFDGASWSIECCNNRHSVYFEDLDNLYECSWLDIINIRSEKQ